MFDERNDQLRQPVEFLECELENKQAEDEKLYRAYVAEVFDETEYRERRKQLKEEGERLTKQAEQLRPRQITREQFEAQKAQILATSEHLRSTGALLDPPFELKRRIPKNDSRCNSREPTGRMVHVDGFNHPFNPLAAMPSVNCRCVKK